MKKFIHDPSAVLDYSFDWSAVLEDDEEITASTWESVGGYLELSSDAFDAETALTVVWVTVAEDTALRTKAILTNHITTSEGREDDRSIELLIANR